MTTWEAWKRQAVELLLSAPVERMSVEGRTMTILMGASGGDVEGVLPAQLGAAERVSLNVGRGKFEGRVLSRKAGPKGELLEIEVPEIRRRFWRKANSVQKI